MQGHSPVTSSPNIRPTPSMAQGPELWRGTWVIFGKHLYKFTRDTTEVGGTLAAPLLLAVTFGAGMNQIVNTAMIGGGSYLSFITPGILAFTALNGSVNAGMTVLEERIKGILKEYFVAPIPRLSVLLASTFSGLTKTLIQSALILLIAVLFGASLQTSPAGVVGALLALSLYTAAFVGFSNGMAMRSKSVGGYHTLLFLLTLPLLFFSNALYPLDTMPVWMRVVAYLNPTTYVVDALRHTLFANGSLPLWLDLTVLAAWAILLSWFGVKSFRKLM